MAYVALPVLLGLGAQSLAQPRPAPAESSQGAKAADRPQTAKRPVPTNTSQPGQAGKPGQRTEQELLGNARRQAEQLRQFRRSRQPNRGPEPSAPSAPPAKPVPPSPPSQDGTFGFGENQPPGRPQRAADTPLPGEKEFNECVKLPRGRRIKLTLKPESELNDLVAWISSMTCKKFIVSGNLRAPKITIVSPTPVTPATAYRAFLSALEVMGLTVVPAGRYLKVVQANWAVQSPVDTYGDKDRNRIPNSDVMLTHIAHVRNVDVNELLLVLNKTKSRNGDVTAYKATNSLILTDNGVNVRRMLRLIDELDVPIVGEKIWVTHMRYADAEEVLKILEKVFVEKGRSPIPTAVPRPPTRQGKVPPEESQASAPVDASGVVASKMVADTLTNSLIIVASPASFARIASLIRKLDVEGGGTSQRIHVYYLENGDAEEIAATLASLTGGAAARPHRGGRGGSPAAGAAAASLFEGDVKTTADKETNSLVIVASTKDFLSLRRVIRQLDIPRRQVFIEAVIMEVSLDNGLTLGAAAHGAAKVNIGGSETLIFGGLQPSQEFSSLFLNPAALTGLAAGARGTPIPGSAELLGVTSDIPAFGVLLEALQTSNDLNVLSAPHLLTSDNQEAEIVVGRNLPFQGGFVGSLAGAAAGSAAATLLPQVSVQRQDVALKLKLTPHVNDSDMVRLELEQEVSDIVAENFNQLGPATSKRTVKTTVVVRDQQTVVIGGLMSDEVREQDSKIPLLGDIPIIGYLFKRTTKTMRKANLLIVLTPHVIRDQGDLRRIFKKKLEERREFIERYTSFKPQEVEHEIDYRHKRGLLAEIHRVALQAEKEAELLDQARKATEDVIDPLEMPDTTPPRPADTNQPAGEPAEPQGAPARPSARLDQQREGGPANGSAGRPTASVRVYVPAEAAKSAEAAQQR